MSAEQTTEQTGGATATAEAATPNQGQRSALPVSPERQALHGPDRRPADLDPPRVKLARILGLAAEASDEVICGAAVDQIAALRLEAESMTRPERRGFR